MESERILINVRGIVYETSKTTLLKYPDTLLAREVRKIVNKQSFDKKIFLQCRAETFDAILFYYQSDGILSRPLLISPEEFLMACQHFEIDAKVIDKLKEREGVSSEEHTISEIQFRFQIQKVFYNMLENQERSIGSVMYVSISSFMVMAAIVLACTVTMPSIIKSRITDLYNDPYFLMELIMNIFFSIEYIIRLIVAPEKCRFVMTTLNIIDLVAFLPFFIVLAVDSSRIKEITLLKVIRIFRIMRVFRLAAKNNTMGTVMNILNNCTLDILTMCMYLLLACVFWASMIYYAEMTVVGTQFVSIPDGMWWAIQTILPIGYGDIVPISGQGKLIGSAVAVLAAFTLTVPLLSLGGKLLNLYSEKFPINIGPDLTGEEPQFIIVE